MDELSRSLLPTPLTLIVMNTACQIVILGSIVPGPLQTLEPFASPTGPDGLETAKT